MYPPLGFADPIQYMQFGKGGTLYSNLHLPSPLG
jgi:hypothetical protein